MKIINKNIFVLVFIFIVLNIIDYFTAISIGSAETNPVYYIFGSFFPLLIIKIILCALVFVVYYYNYYQTRFLLYIYIFILLEGIILLCYGIYTNINVLMNPEIIIIASTISTEVKVKQYFNLFQYFYLFPLIISTITFFVYKGTENKVKYK